jgi:hypothetical protein
VPKLLCFHFLTLSPPRLAGGISFALRRKHRHRIILETPHRVYRQRSSPSLSPCYCVVNLQQARCLSSQTPMPTNKDRTGKKRTHRRSAKQKRQPQKNKVAAQQNAITRTPVAKGKHVSTPEPAPVATPLTPRDTPAAAGTGAQSWLPANSVLHCVTLAPVDWKNARQLAACSIATSETLARGTLDYQARTMGWAKHTPWASLLNSYLTLAQQWVAGVGALARQFWGIADQYRNE